MQTAKQDATENTTPELLAPAGSFETALAAFAAGADAVYLGLDAFSARAEAVNFSADQLKDLVAYARKSPRSPKKIYVTFNTLITDPELPSAVEKLAILDEIAPDGIIVQDIGIARIARKHFPSLELHASTQLVAHNLEGVLALRDLGFTRVVLARELSADEIRSISRRCAVETEVFVHGALCYSLSGLCLFSAMEKNRSGNRGRCAYCCRLAYTDASGKRSLPFSMRDLRLDDSLGILKDAGVASLKIEGRMKSPLYVASVVKRYREILDGTPITVTRADLETVFSRRTTSLYINGYPDPRKPAPSEPPVIDSTSLGHLGTRIGIVKRITRDRENRAWIRFHTSRALERHDGLQFAKEGDKPFGFGISEMRTALSRKTTFSVPAGTDVEILLPQPQRGSKNPGNNVADPVKPGAVVYCSASNEIKRRFPIPSFRPNEVSAGIPISVHAAIDASSLTVDASIPNGVSTNLHLRACELHGIDDWTAAKNPAATPEAFRKAFSKLGGTNWTLCEINVDDPLALFIPPAALNEARRRTVAALDEANTRKRKERIAAASAEEPAQMQSVPPPQGKVLKLRIDQTLPDDSEGFSEVVVAVGHLSGRDVQAAIEKRFIQCQNRLRLALPIFTHEADYNALRSAVKHLLRSGFKKWEAADVAGLRLLRALEISDVTADWSVYAFNRAARAQLAELGASRMVTSPEMSDDARAELSGAKGAPAVEFLERQSTPLFISLTRPEIDDPSRLTGMNGDEFRCYFSDGLWTTVRPEPLRFNVPENAPLTRIDLSWDTPNATRAVHGSETGRCR